MQFCFLEFDKRNSHLSALRRLSDSALSFSGVPWRSQRYHKRELGCSSRTRADLAQTTCYSGPTHYLRSSTTPAWSNLYLCRGNSELSPAANTREVAKHTSQVTQNARFCLWSAVAKPSGATAFPVVSAACDQLP